MTSVTEYEGHWIELTSGNKFNYLFPKQNQSVKIEDIAHALSNICRFGGHCKEFYSVGQHSCRVAMVLEESKFSPYVVLNGLMHDAAEAIVGDMPRPIKYDLPDYMLLHNNVEAFLQKRFGYSSQPIVQYVDNKMLSTEARDLGLSKVDWAELPEPYAASILPAWDPKTTKKMFLEIYRRVIDATSKRS